MGQGNLKSWLREREPPLPEPFLVQLQDASGSPAVDGGLEDLAVRALEEALRNPGRERVGAFHLLAADAWITYACEAAAGRPDVPGRLLGLLTRIGGPLK